MNRAQTGIVLSDEQIASASVRDLCANYGPNRDARVRTELERRHLFSADDWKRIHSARIPIGTREEIMWCQIGLPGEFGDISEVQTSAGPGTRYRYVYGSLMTQDIIVVDGRVFRINAR